MRHYRCHMVLAGFLSVLAGLVAAEPGTVTIPGESRTTAGRLDEARRHLREGKSTEAVAALQALLESAATELAPLGDQRSISGRLLAQAMLAKLSPADLAAHRRRLDVQARRWLELADSTGERTPLYRLVQEAFCSRQTATALDRLGDLAFLRGRFDEAESWWRLISPLQPVAPREQDPASRVYPDPSPDLAARVVAKQLLARIHGRHPQIGELLDAYRKRFPRAAGTLAGRSGLYAETLATIAAELASQPPPQEVDWPTFGGSLERGSIASAPPRLLDRLSQLCRAGPTWTFDLEARGLLEANVLGLRAGEELDAARRLAFHPVVVGSLALVADARYVTAYDLRTGRSSTWYDAGKAGVGGFHPRLNLPAPLDLRYTLTVAEGCVFARLGTQAVRDVRPEPRKLGRPGLAVGDAGESLLVCLSLTPGPDGDRRRWMVRGWDLARKDYSVFEGAPLVRDGRVWIAATRFEGDRVVTAVHSYPAHPEDVTAPLLWRTDVCETRELLPASGGELEQSRKQRLRHHLLTLAGSKVVYCSHSGAIVALDARTGRRTWAVRYPRRDECEPEDEPGLRDLAPPIYAEGKLYVAPSDSDRLYCLDPETGATIWERDRLDVVHLIGVGQGRLIFTTWRNPSMGRLHAGGLRAVMAADGSDEGGWSLPDDGGGLIPMGRPLLVGDLVLWPTARRPFGVFAVRQQDGQQPDNPSLLHRIPSGNLVYANGCLLVAERQTMAAFVPPEMMQEDEAKDPRMGARQRAEESESALLRSDGNPRQRLTLMLQAAEAWREAGNLARADRFWDEIRRTPTLASLLLEDERGLPQRAAVVAHRQLGGVDTHPRPLAASMSSSLPAWTTPVTTRARVGLAAWERFLGADGESLHCSRPNAFLLRERNTGKEVWQTALGFTPIWSNRQGNQILAAGAEGIVALEAAHGALLWRLPAPPTRLYPVSHGHSPRAIDEVNAPALGDFHLVGELLVCTQGQRRLLCLDTQNGVVRWQRPAPGAGFDMPEPRGRIRWVVPLRRDRLLVQAATRRWVLDLLSGSILASSPSQLEPWPREPLVVDENTCCLVPDRETVLLLDSQTGRVRWTHRLQGNFIRSGEPPLPVLAGESLLVVEPLNIGFQIQKLERATGRPLWSRPPLERLERLGAAGWIARGETLFHAGGDRLSAWSLRDGKRLWQRPLPASGAWRLEAVGGTLVAWRERAASWRFQLRWLGGALQWHVGPLPIGEAWAFFLLDAQSGAVRQRIPLDPESLPRRPVSGWKTGVSVWPLAVVDRDMEGAPGPVVRCDGRGLLASVGNRVLVLTGEPSARSPGLR